MPKNKKNKKRMITAWSPQERFLHTTQKLRSYTISSKRRNVSKFNWRAEKNNPDHQ